MCNKRDLQFTEQWDLSQELLCVSWSKKIVKEQVRKAMTRTVKKMKKRKPIKRHYLFTHDLQLYLTEQEVRVATMLVLGKTQVMIAKEMKLSVRTIEYYVKNMRQKCACDTSGELIKLLLNATCLSEIEA